MARLEPGSPSPRPACGSQAARDSRQRATRWFAWMVAGIDRGRYDRVGHLMQGFVPALIACEILLRSQYVSGPRMAAFLSGCVALVVSAFYELVEWWAALALGQGADAFLGTQGDPWDTQSDMLMALIGAVTALLTLTRLQDRQIARLTAAPAAVLAPASGR